MWILLILFFLFPISTSAIDYQESASTTVSASIPENRVTIFGYTSPNSRVELSSPKVFAVTYSNQEGYFIFDKSILPRNPSDLCLISFDNHGRATSPTCIPAPPPYNYHTDIGAILLPPTISLENSQIDPNSTVITSGQAIPNSIVNIHFYKVNDSGQSFFNLDVALAKFRPKQVQAYSLPSITATSDSFGNFNLNLPTAYSSDYRLYASAKFNDNYSPKSNTLIYFLPSFFSLFLQKYPFLYFLIPLLILSIIILFLILYLRSDLYRLVSKKYLPAIPNWFPVVQNHFPAIKKYYPAATSCRTKSPSSKTPQSDKSGSSLP